MLACKGFGKKITYSFNNFQLLDAFIQTFKILVILSMFVKISALIKHFVFNMI